MGKLKVIPYDLPEGNEVGISKMEITYCQEQDTNHNSLSETEGDQELTISTECAYVDREEALKHGNFYLIVKTNGWAINDGQELADLVEDFNNRLLLTVEKEEKTETK